MSAKVAKAKASDRVSLKDLPPPASAVGLMNRNQVCAALGGISVRKLSMMVASGEFHRADFRVGESPRWTVLKFNQWVEANRHKHDDGGPG